VMAPISAQLAQAPSEEDLGFFFRRLGEICFHPASDQDWAGPACAVAVAATCGAVFFADSQGMLGPKRPNDKG
jgi:hypothetical protein